MGKSILITQSNYIPWRGYFDAINRVDEVVLLDDVQYTRRDWRNRNRIKTAAGLRWLTIPVQVKGRFTQLINETRVADPDWGHRHLATLTHCYARAPHFGSFEGFLERLYLADQPDLLSHINSRFISAICFELGIDTPIRPSHGLSQTMGRNRRLIAICRELDATEYHTGPAARAYLDEAAFEAAGINVRWLEFSGYPEYPQLHGPFEHAVTILDLLFHTGPHARDYMKT